MSEQSQKPNTQENHSTDIELDSSQHVSQADIDSEIERSTAPLEAYQRGVIGEENRRKVGEHIMKIATIVNDNPERVAVDIEKHPTLRTEHDPERAHLIALAIDKNMARLAIDERHSNTSNPVRKAWNMVTAPRHNRDLIGAAMGAKIAAEAYNEDPLRAGPHVVVARRQASIDAGHKTYKYIKGAKLPRL